MTKIKTVPVILGVVIAGLLGTNSYTYMQLNTAKDEVTLEKQEIQRQEEAMDVFVSQVMNKSAQYASHEDMTLAFNIYSASNRIHYKGNDYYADLKDVTAHSFDEREEVKYQAEANLTFLKDKMVNNMSYLQNQLPVELMEKAINIAKGLEGETAEEHAEHSEDAHEGETAEEHAEHSEHEEHAHEIHIPYVDTMAMEKEAKEAYEVHVWNQTLDFNMDGQIIIELTPKMKQDMLKQFILGVALEEKGMNAKEAIVEIESLEVIDTIVVTMNNETLKFSYNKDTKELQEK